MIYLDVRWKNVIWLCLILHMAAAGQVSRRPMYISMLASLNQENNHPASIVINPATGIATRSFSFYAGVERKFMLSGFKKAYVLVAVPFGKDCVAVDLETERLMSYGATGVSLSFAKRLGDRVSVGATFLYTKRKAVGYKGYNEIGTRLGLLFRLANGLDAGVAFENAFGLWKTNAKAERALASASMGLTYTPSATFGMSVFGTREENSVAAMKLSMLYKPLRESLWLRFGFCSNPGSLFMGVVLVRKGVRLEVLNSWHQRLGSTPAIGLLYQRQPKPA